MPDFRGNKLFQFVDRHAMQNKYITREELYELCDNKVIHNERDKVFLILPYEGILGEDYKDMRLLEKSQIKVEENKILVNGKRKEIIIDPRSMEYINLAMHQVTYYISNGNPHKSAKLKEREILKTKYVLEYADANRIEETDAIIRKETITTLFHQMKRVWEIRQYLSPTLLFDSGFIDYCNKIKEGKGNNLTMSDYESACIRYGLSTDLSTVERYKKKYESYKQASE